MMKLQNFRIIFSSIVILSLFVFIPINDSYGSEITYSDITSPDNLSFRDYLFPGPTPPFVITIDDILKNKGGNGTINIDDFNKNLNLEVKDFTSAVIVQPSSETIVFANETGDSTHIFDGEFKVTDKIVNLELSESENCAPDAFVCYEPDPENAIRAKVKLPSGFSGYLTFSDYNVTDNEANGACFYPVIGALNITGTLNVQPEIWISYTNANFTGVAAGNNQLNLGMYYKHQGDQFEKITNAFIEGDFEFLDTRFHEGTIKSKNSGDTGTTTGKGILDPGGWAGISDYQGIYVLGLDNGCSGGGGGGLVRPSLVVNALAGIGGLGGGTDGTPPMIELSELVKFSHLEIPLEIEQMVLNHDSTVPMSPMEVGLVEGFDYPLTINDKGFVLGGFTSTIETQTIKTNTTAVIKFILYETTKIQHLSLYTNLRDANSQIHQSDTQILFNDEQELQIKDPNGFFRDVSVIINDINENKKEAVFEITFDKPMDTSHVIVRSWDPFFNSRDAIILDAIIVEPEIIEESPIPAYEEPIIEQLQSQSIPIWIKNNAAWWSDQQIGDSDFIAGIEYLIKNGIITVPGVEAGLSPSSTEIPDWIKNNAGWWADSLITDDDFTEAMQWLIVNGVIQI